METAKIFENGRSQAVRLPKKFRFDVDDLRTAGARRSACPRSSASTWTKWWCSSWGTR